MSFGFKVWDALGVARLSSDDFSVASVDVFTVSPTSTGSKTYTDAGGYNFIVTQTQVEPSSVDLASLRSFNSVNISVTTSGNDKIVSWSPSKQIGSLYNVIIYVMGA